MLLLRLLFATAVAVAALAASASAATITGQVLYDPPGAVSNVPVPGAVVEVRTAANAIVGPAVTTDANGTYSKAVFDSAQPRGKTYKVILTSPYSYVTPSDGRHDTVQVFGANTTSNIDFSVRGTTVSGLVFNDIDASGDKQADEPYLKGATVTIDGPVDKTVTTDAGGAYTSGPPVLPAGGYTVSAAKAGYAVTTPPRIVNVAAGADSVPLPSGLHPATGTVQGDAYAETNGQPGRQAGEPPIAGATISVSGTADGSPFTLQTTSAADGTWSLLVFAGGNRTVSASQPAGYADGPESSTAATGVAGADAFTAVTVPTDDVVGRFAFGETGATVAGVTFSDRDGDGMRDAGEPGIAGRALTVSAGGFTADATSGAGGAWSVKGAPAGALTVTPAAFADALTPAPRVVNPGAGATVAADLGFRYANLRGTVVNRQTGAAVGGVSVLLSGTAQRTVTTAADGSFEFPELAPGTYGVRADPPAGLGLGTHKAGTAGGSADAGGVTGVTLSLAQLGTGYELGVTGAPATTGSPAAGGGGGGAATGGGKTTTQGSTGGGGGPAARDTTKPGVRLSVTGRLRRGARIGLKVKATDASGISRVTIAVGRRRAATRSALRLRLPRRAGKVVITVTAIDRAGNRTTVKRTLRVR